MKPLFIIGAAAALWLAAISHAGAAPSITADIKLFQFKPKTLEIKAGTTVTWTNADAIDHSVTAGEPGKESGAFDSGFFTKGQSWAHTFSAPGVYTYFCKRHPNMTATVKVSP